MPDQNVPALTPESGERLVSKDYKRDFRERQALIRGGASWKLERRQYFEEQNDPSRDALTRGDWQEVLRLFAADRDIVLARAREDRSRGHAFYRVRIVEYPITPYVQWELHWLKQDVELGASRVRIVTADHVADAEKNHQLPEIVILDGRTLYHVLYTDNGQPMGSIRFTDPQRVHPWERYITSLYEAGEDIASYFAREIAPLPAPPPVPSPVPQPE
ncbi:DUF6879 family protein [Streptomyces corynorhini]|uniref:DUF6879 domain-containing protein n=1 Tax=Streptomyces corynorhini TaxID=2282652 RepID=A0A370B893_9ACTN|nr:DUF6879 family protein [Streptomyces corynorhini]RDG36872.1 hypothetical protein DVH02_17625 [Streptomyces corynorhini]